MPRRPRDIAAGIFHVYTHCVWAADAFFRDDFDRRALIHELPGAIEQGGWTCIAFCLMTTHHHLIIEVPENGLPIGMHHLNFRYAEPCPRLLRLSARSGSDASPPVRGEGVTFQ